MQPLLKELKTYFNNGNKSLKNFLPTFKKVFNPEKVRLKNKRLVGTYSKEKLFENEHFEIVFITWGAHCESPIHCHPENGCILTVLDGNLVEERYNNKGVLCEYNFIKCWDVGYMDNYIGKHRIINKNDYNVYSFHVYSPPGYYDKCCKN